MAKSESYHLLADRHGRLLEMDERLRGILGYRLVEIKAISLHSLFPGLVLPTDKRCDHQPCYVRCRDGKDLQMACTLFYTGVDGGRYVVIVHPAASDPLYPVQCWPGCSGMGCDECPVGLVKRSRKIEQTKKLMPGKRRWRITAIPICNNVDELEHVLFIGEDITTQLIIAEEVRQSHKLESLGILAGGIAHDFNNILSGIRGYTELALGQVKDQSLLKDYLLEVSQAGKRATELVRQILTFSRRGEGKLVSTDLPAIVEEVVKLLRSSFPAKVMVKKRIDRGVKPVLADPVQMHQVVMNLLTNASHAMDPWGGELTVSVQPIDLPGYISEQNPELIPGEYLLLTVADTGIGMTKEVLESMFDPYFTTKPSGQGTGLGLSVVHGIVKECGGHIGVESTPGEGTVFTIYLPTIEPASTDAEKESIAGMLEGTETIMVVDDEPEILKIARTILELHGYSVLTERNSQRALEAVVDAPEAIDLLIADITMPHLSGDQLAREVLAVRPDLPVILMTGYTDLSADQIRKRDKVSALVMKPLGGKNFLVQVRMLLDQKKNRN